MKTALFALLLFAVPSAAIADTADTPVNYMVWHGTIINLDHLWGKGSAPSVPVAVAQPQSAAASNELERSFETREVRENQQRVNAENARSQAMQELLRR